MLRKHDRATQAYCATQVATWRKASQKLRSTISYRSHRAQCMQQAWQWMAKARELQEG